MVNQHKIAAVQVLCEMKVVVDNLGMYNLTSHVISRVIDLTLQYGLAPYSALGFALASHIYVSENNDIDSGFRFARIAASLVDVLHAPRLQSRVLLYSGFAFHWRRPLSNTLDYWIDAYQKGMRAGDLNAATKNITLYGLSYFYSGLPLEAFVADIENFCMLMYEYGQKMMVLANVPVYQCVLNLTGQSSNVLDMANGKACEYRIKLGYENRIGEQAEWSYHMQIAFYCEEFVLATELYEKLKSIYAGSSRGLPLFHARIFFFSLICMHNAKHDKHKRRWRGQAKKYMGIVRKWVIDKQAINVGHKLMILNAEMMSIECHKQEEERDAELMVAFDMAIRAATKAGFLQDAALAAHLASRAVSKKRTRLEYFRRACSLYDSWGTVGVVEHIEVKNRSMLLENADSSSRPMPRSSTCVRSRRRFDDALITQLDSVDF